jgi:two-component system, sensor histidine kinase
MQLVLFLVAVLLACSLVAVRLRGRAEATRLRHANEALEVRVAERTRELTLALQAADDQAMALKSASQAKSDFLAAMSHELRTPLNAVIGFSDLMRMNAAAEPLTRRQEQSVDHILTAGRHLLCLIEEILDLSRIEAGGLSMSIERVDPQLVIREVCESLRPEAVAAGIDLKGPPPTAGMGVTADRTRLRQVLLNLITNAIKYNSPGGTVLVEARQDGQGVTISVHDTGAGIPRDRMNELFEPFNRLGRETSAVPGAGIGLAVSRRLAEAMGGSLRARSVEAEGSTFSLHLPGARLDAATIVASPVQPLMRPLISGRDAVVLYVEDNPPNVALMRHVVSALGGIRLHVAETGETGLALSRDLGPDVIILDINLPDMTGFELKARLDADPLTQNVPVVALSASAMPRDIKQGRAAGFVDYLTKPFDIAALARALQKAIDDKPTGMVVESPARRSS